MKYLKTYNEAVGEMKLTCGIYLFDVNNKLLIQHPTNFRATVWGIPKGRFDADETDVFEVCKRELFEETGIVLDDYNIVHKEELDIAQYNDTNKFLKSYFVKVDSDLSDVKLYCDSMVMRNEKPAFPEVDEWKWVDIDEADRIFAGDRMSSFQENNIKRCKLILSKLSNGKVYESISKMYHVTNKNNVDSILKYGLLINKEYYMTDGGKWSTEVYGLNPIYLSMNPDKTAKQKLKTKEDVIFEVDVNGLELVADLPALVDWGAYIDDSQEFIWFEKRVKIRKYEDEDGCIYFEDLLNPDLIVTEDSIKMTKSAAVMTNINPKRIKLL